MAIQQAAQLICMRTVMAVACSCAKNCTHVNRIQIQANKQFSICIMNGLEKEYLVYECSMFAIQCRHAI